VAALAGMHSIVVGFDYEPAAADRNDFLGFAVHRSDLTDDESRWLTGQIRFQSDLGDFGDEVPTNRAPLQKFHWGDYTAKPGRAYRFRVHAVHGRPPDRLELDRVAPVEVTVRAADNRRAAIGVHFNRGVTAALAYQRRFGDVPPAEVANGAAHRWLSRGLEEALLGFIAGARAGDELRVGIYEFEYVSVIEALKAARERGVTVVVAYHARRGDAQTEENDANVDLLQLPPAQVSRRTAVPNISHNKLIVHRRNGAPIRVWSGSTNMTAGGFYLQTNVGLVFTDPAIVAAYDEYFDLLFRNLARRRMHEAVARLNAARGPIRGGELFFAPVADERMLETARATVAGAKSAIFISCPFGLDRSIADALNANAPGVLEYGLVNVTNRKRLLGIIDRSPNAWYATPAWLPRYDGRIWDAHAYGNHKVHVKSIVVDPWSTSPRVLIGSANFSDESVRLNDENSLFVEGDRRLAAIVATEFLRMFDHYKFRDYLRRAEGDVGERFLVEDGSWAAPYYTPTHPKFTDRLVFSGQ
jgi:phosphatidylserine/phosphatidylglycerophosphate/cardiolipin synthase-like enzyme